MPRLPKEKPQPDPFAWVADGRWAGESRFELQSHECERAAWYAGRWATPHAPALKRVKWPGWVLKAVRQPTPPDGVEGPVVELTCGACFHRAVCGGASLAVNCRTCRNVVADGAWRCRLDGAVLDADMQRAGCDHWESAVT